MNYLYLFEEYTYDITIERENKKDLRESFKGYYNGELIGHFDLIDNQNNTVTIIGYNLVNRKFLGRGLGYSFIKKCIDYLLTIYDKIYSDHDNRNKKSNKIWNKLMKEDEYHIEITDNKYILSRS